MVPAAAPCRTRLELKFEYHGDWSGQCVCVRGAPASIYLFITLLFFHVYDVCMISRKQAMNSDFVNVWVSDSLLIGKFGIWKTKRTDECKKKTTIEYERMP